MIWSAVAALGSDVLVGLSLGLIGGGGSILAKPLLLFVVGVSQSHVAVGTSALAVAANAYANLVGHARCGRLSMPGDDRYAAATAIWAKPFAPVPRRKLPFDRQIHLAAAYRLLTGGPQHDGRNAMSPRRNPHVARGVIFALGRPL